MHKAWYYCAYYCLLELLSGYPGIIVYLGNTCANIEMYFSFQPLNKEHCMSILFLRLNSSLCLNSDIGSKLGW